MQKPGRASAILEMSPRFSHPRNARAQRRQFGSCKGVVVGPFILGIAAPPIARSPMRFGDIPVR